MRRAAGLIAAVVLSLSLSAAAAPDRFARLPDHRRMHLVCTGSGAPTVLLESGFGADSGAWYKVQPKLAQRMRVCSYDRAGAGQSDPGPFPRDGAAIAKDLDQTLKAAAIPGPFIGVGHSAGGLYIRLFAARRPGELKGLVLVDPSVEHQVRRTEALYGPGAGSVESIRQGALLCQHFVEKTPVSREDPLWKRCIDPDPVEQKTSLSPYKWRTQVSEIETLFTTTSDEVDAKGYDIRKVPVIILTAVPADGQSGPAQNLQRRFHAELKDRFAHAEQRLIPSGHLMFFDAPDAIVTAVADVSRKR